jgi:hypothetical protein
MSSKTDRIGNRVKFGKQVAQIGMQNADAVAQAQLAIFGALTPAAAIAAVLLAQSQQLGEATDGMEAARQAVLAEEADDVPYRTRRDEVGVEMTQIMSSAAQRIEALPGMGGLRIYALDVPVPAAHESQRIHVGRVIKQLESNPIDVQDRFGGSFNTEGVIEALEPLHQEFSALLDDLVREDGELKQRRAEFAQAEALWQSLVTNVAATVEAQLRLARMDYLADRVRPSFARTSGVEFDDAPVEPPVAPTPELG